MLKLSSKFAIQLWSFQLNKLICFRFMKSLFEIILILYSLHTFVYKGTLLLLNSERNLSDIKRTEVFCCCYFVGFFFFFPFACQHVGKYIKEHNLQFWNYVLLLNHIWVLPYSESFFTRHLGFFGCKFCWVFLNSSSSVSVSVLDIPSLFNPTLH